MLTFTVRETISSADPLGADLSAGIRSLPLDAVLYRLAHGDHIDRDETAPLRAVRPNTTAMICTDNWLQGVADKNTNHATVNHREQEYVRGFVHTNTLENAWWLFRRSIVGSYHQISVKHLDRYLDEFEFRF